MGALDIFTLQEAKDFLNIEDSSDDAELAGFISGVTAVVEDVVGPVVPRPVTSIFYPTQERAIPLPVWPVISLTSGQLVRNGSPVDVTNMVIDRGALWMKNYAILPVEPFTLTYQAGRATTPDNIKKGAQEILKLAWASQRNSDAPAFLISYRAMAWLQPEATSLGFA